MNNNPPKIRRSRTSSGNPNPVDVHVGLRIRLRRLMMGLSQKALGRELGMTFQQVQKYERGANRICASKLFEVAAVLCVPVAYFFEDMEATGLMLPGPHSPMERNPDSGVTGQEQLSSRETLELARSFCRIVDPHIRQQILELAQSLAAFY